MPIRPLADAQKVFDPHAEKLIEVVETVYANILKTCASILHSLEDGTKAAMVSNLIVSELRAWADKTDGVEFLKQGNLRWLGFKNNWIVRVKMLNDRDVVGVSPTEASDQYNRNTIPDSIKTHLLDEDEATLLYLGWRTTENSPVIPEVSLVCNNSFGEPHWVWRLRGAPPPPMLELPIPDAPAGGVDDGQRRIKVRAEKTVKEA